MTTKHIRNLAVIGLLACAQQAQAIEIDLGSLGSLLRVSGTADTFTFRNVTGAGIPTPGSSFQIAGVNGGAFAPNSLGDRGRIEGTWQIGTVVSFGDLQQSTDLTSVGIAPALKIWDGAPGSLLSGSIFWGSMSSLYNSFNNTTTLSINGEVTGITYGGSETDLQELRDTLGGVASLTISFSFTGNRGLTQLKASTINNDTSFSGDLNAVTPPPPEQVPDGGTTVAMLGAGFLLLGAFRRKLMA